LLHSLHPLSHSFELLVHGLDLLIRGLGALAGLPRTLVHFVQPALNAPESRGVLFQLSLDEPGLRRQLLQPLVQGYPRPLALLYRGLDAAANFRFHLSQPLLGEIARALVGTVERRHFVPERRDIAPRTENILVGCATA
jgi:hypothetical protein